MKTKTTTREYDADGNMVKETVAEYDDAPIRASIACTCAWNRSTTLPYCPAHGYGYGYGYAYGVTWTSPTFTINGGVVQTNSTPAVSVSSYSN